MFFRPEEVHGASCVGGVEHPPSDREGDIADHAFWVHPLDLAVLYLHPYRLTAIEAYRIDLYRLSGKEPADRQRFKRSLAEPLLFPVYRQAVMGRKIIEGRKGYDGVPLGEEPPRKAESREELMERRFAFPRRHAQLRCNLCVVWRLPRFHHSFHDDTEGSVP